MELTDLEIKIAYQDKIIADLNDVVTEQQNTIERLTTRLDKLETDFRNQLGSDVKEIDQETPPPHY